MARPFLHTETDGNEPDYFIIHQAEIIRRALKEFMIMSRASSETASAWRLYKNIQN